jgi:hypothetical protein
VILNPSRIPQAISKCADARLHFAIGFRAA